MASYGMYRFLKAEIFKKNPDFEGIRGDFEKSYHTPIFSNSTKSCHVPVNETEIICPSGAISLAVSDTGTKPFSGGLINFSCTQSLTQAAEPDLWKSTVTSA